MTPSIAAALIVAALTSLAPFRATAGPVDELHDAENWFVYGDFERVVLKLSPLVDPTSQLADRRELARSYELLGLSCFYLRREAEARRYFERLIRLEPEKPLDPLVVPPPAIHFYEELRASMADEIARQREALQKQLAEEDERRRRANIVVEKIELRRNSRLMAALPLGLGQLQDGQVLTGGLLMGSQLLLAGLSGGFFLATENLRQPSGRYAHSDVSRAEAFQAAQLSCGYAALLIALGGIIHAELTFREDTEIRRDVSAPGVEPDLGPRPELDPAAPGPAATLGLPLRFSFFDP